MTGDARLRLGENIAERLLALGAAAIRLAMRLPRDSAGRHIAQQLIRSATAGGANYEEARAAESRDDFVHKVSIAAKEVREACYWLRLIEQTWSAADAGSLATEATQLASILGASARTARRKSGRPRDPDC
jgi:four helix bundle protein